MSPAANTKNRAPIRAGGRGRRSVARLAAAQALYQILLTGTPAETVVAEFLAHRLGGGGDAAPLAGGDRTLFADLVRGAAARSAELDGFIAPALAEGWPLERLETILRAILWAGAYELSARPDIPLEVVIDEYVTVAHAFFAGREPAFVNGVLDRLGHRLRGDGLEAAVRDETTPGA